MKWDLKFLLPRKEMANLWTWCFLVTILLNLCARTLACPKQCFCNTMSSVVHCSEKGLTFIPSGIPTDTMQLNLNSNPFQVTTLKRLNFTRYGLLEHLYLSDCKIRAIEVGTFIDLSRLKWLDLSKNRIRDLQDFTFRGLYLEQLFLNGNDGLKLHRDTFNGLKATGVFLHRCGLQSVSLEILRPINDSLKSLTLDNNNIRKIGREMQYIFSSLTHLRLNGNALHCNCEMLWLKQFYDSHLDIFKGAQAPSCMSPSHTHRRGFNRLTPRDFRCQPPIFNDVDLLFANENGILSCSASGDPAPTLYWIKPNGMRNAYPPPSGDMSVKTEGTMKISHVEGIYTGGYECLAMNAGGNVTLTLNVTWPKIERQTIIKYIERDPIIITPKPPQLAKKPEQQSDTTDSDDNDDSPEENFKIFTMLELVSAVLGTFVSTVLVCVIVFHLLFRIRSSKFHRNRLDTGYSANTSVYLARSDESDFMTNKEGHHQVYTEGHHPVYTRPR